jgi:hypothetical protein
VAFETFPATVSAIVVAIVVVVVVGIVVVVVAIFIVVAGIVIGIVVAVIVVAVGVLFLRAVPSYVSRLLAGGTLPATVGAVALSGRVKDARTLPVLQTVDLLS